MINRLFVFLAQWGEVISSITLAACIALMFAISCLGCSSTCPPPSVVTVPQVVEVPVPVQGEPLPVCVPSHKVCDQPGIVDRVKCLGGNIAELDRCNAENTAALEAHNKGVTDAPPS